MAAGESVGLRHCAWSILHASSEFLVTLASGPSCEGGIRVESVCSSPGHWGPLAPMPNHCPKSQWQIRSELLSLLDQPSGLACDFMSVVPSAVCWAGPGL